MNTALLENAREKVRVEGIDPVRESARLRELVELVVGEYEANAMVGKFAALDNPQETVSSICANIGGFGPLQGYLDDNDVEEIWINAPHKVFVAKAGVSELTSVLLAEADVRDLVERMLRDSGRRLDFSSPFVDAQLASGERLHVVIPPVSGGNWAVNIRKHTVRAQRLQDLVERETLTEQAAVFLAAAARVGLNILVSGATQAGKTTMLRAICGEIAPIQRIITCEEVFELNLTSRDCVALQTRPPSLEGGGEITLRRLVKESLRMRPDRLVIGEVRGAEALDMLVALNAGIPGASSLHANSAREALSKLALLPLLGGENITSDFVTPTIASAIDVVVHMNKDSRGHRNVREIIAVTGRVEGASVETSELFIDRGAGLQRANGNLQMYDRFANFGFDLGQLLHGGS